MSGNVYPLKGEQALAVDPRECVWLSASAGTGKTQVLSARVLRLLLQEDTDPSQLLCLTFTKAGAAEMAVRVNQVLAKWVRMSDTALGADLLALGAKNDPATLERARTLFASVLDCPGGGLRIDTIHAFSQWLLATFPEEAQIAPGSRAMEDRDRDLLSHEVLSQMLTEAERQGDRTILDPLEEFSRRKGPDEVRGWLMRCASAGELWEGTGHWQPPMKPRVLQLLGLPSDSKREDAAAMCTDDRFDVQSLRRCLETIRGWGTSTAEKMDAAISHWLALEPEGRAARIGSFYEDSLLTKTGSLRSLNNLAKKDAEYEEYGLRVVDSIEQVETFLALIELADFLSGALELGYHFAKRWEEAKAREGFVDFDDQIRRAAALLSDSDMAPWIRYKLDRQFDHILIDEAQDTNAEQWEIIFALIDDFFSGVGAHDMKLRTIFTVGDYKQAIFCFQGTSPENFERAKEQVRKMMEAEARGIEESRANYPVRRLREYGLGQSFRTAVPILEFVDKAIDRIGYEAIGLKDPPKDHQGLPIPGQVTLWKPVTVEKSDDDDGDGEDGWLPTHERAMADRLAAQVREWLDTGYPLHKGDTPRNAQAGDILVLVRARKELAGLIVARLHAAGVPVAGVDRLRLGAPLAVKDLMAALRFAAQPLDDLNLANLLVSPLIGWSQEELLDHGWRKSGRLWEHLRQSHAPFVAGTLEKLGQLLRLADYEPPIALLHWMLVGPWQGRRKLVARLGHEANDPIDELLNAAHAYASAHTPSLQGFIRWFDAGDGELKRDSGESGGLVRVMTVHGSKGLQAPIVILADATGKPGDRPSIELVEQQPGDEHGRKVPIPAVGKEWKRGPVGAAEEQARVEELQEHWRLLYVAMTRAEEALFIGGSLGPKSAKNGPHEDSWYARLEPLFEADELADEIWGARREVGECGPAVVGQGDVAIQQALELPGWAVTPIGPEPRPPRPLAPSSAGEEQGADPPLPPDVARDAARRGVLIHRLLERLPDIPAEQREAAGAAWLERQARELSDEARREMLASALAVLAEPEFADIFSPGALAEVPLAAIVEGQVVAGIADRLLVAPEKVTVVDFKTARRPPASLEQVQPSAIRQMAAYAAALEAIYPGREIACALLYTQTPRLIEIPADVVAEAKSALSTKEESYSPAGVE